jgi:preprotein translocase subunit SecE
VIAAKPLEIVGRRPLVIAAKPLEIVGREPLVIAAKPLKITMTEQVENEATALDVVKLTLGILVFAGGIAGFYLLGEQPPVVQWLIVLASFGIGAFIAMQSSFGREFGQFVTTARGELRKVVWPTQSETVKTTAVVFVFVVIMGFFFWGLDVLLGWATKQLTGQGG